MTDELGTAAHCPAHALGQRLDTCSEKRVKRNPRLFNGKYISVTRRSDGSLRLNFKELKTIAGFKVERYALGVYNEICMALEGLVEEVTVYGLK